uniref:Uncharacterized protein n=1 Tax=Chromera velia CCMP2878 TaxID=1169474 RepID=A0A0G4F619_9ALVE|eukprot:Cvel_15289.t1-p1 / transcript=Cvel_15289.t1 / gene=Cvel_15289 / organism=Chromera_velia_CCMP2878 / gene_product=hypothetical protein / transcript_product=hypothetical protein / location=Cvel_scaffold1122:1980-11903(-) / protein_length=524 / sequence_SO=supercontig / SO=protein_coding / is_pseudo=false
MTTSPNTTVLTPHLSSVVGAIKGMRGALFSVGGVLVFVALMCTAFVFVPRDPVICASLGWNGATFKTRDKGFAYTFVGSKTEEGKSTGNFFLPLHLELTMTNDNFFPVILDEVFVHVGYLTSQSDFGGAPVEIAMDKVDVTGDNNEDFKIPSRETATWKQWVVTREHGTHFLEALEELGTPKYLSCYKQESFDSKKEKEQIKSTIIERFSAYVVTKTKVLGFWTHKSTAKVPIGMDNQVKTLRIHCPSRDFARLGSHYELLEAPDASEAPEAESQRSCSNTERLSKEFEVSLASSPERETETEVDEEKVVAGALRGRPSSSGVVLTKSEGAKEADELTELDDEEEDDDDVQEEEEETEGEDLDGDLEDSQGGEDGEEKSKVAVWAKVKPTDAGVEKTHKTISLLNEALEVVFGDLSKHTVTNKAGKRVTVSVTVLHHFTTSLNNRIGYAEGEARRATEEATARAAAAGAAATGRRGRVQEEDAKMEDVQDEKGGRKVPLRKRLAHWQPLGGAKRSSPSSLLWSK